MTVKLNLETTRGDTTEWFVTYLVDGVKTDITGAKLWMTAQRGAGGPIIFQLTSEPSGGIVIDADQITNPGKAAVKLKPESTSGLASEPVNLVYDVQILINGDIKTISTGALLVSPDVTLDVA